MKQSSWVEATRTPPQRSTGMSQLFWRPFWMVMDMTFYSLHVPQNECMHLRSLLEWPISIGDHFEWKCYYLSCISSCPGFIANDNWFLVDKICRKWISPVSAVTLKAGYKVSSKTRRKRDLFHTWSSYNNVLFINVVVDSSCFRLIIDTCLFIVKTWEILIAVLKTEKKLEMLV